MSGHKAATAGPFTAADRAFMARALKLAARGRGWVSPNPMVGAVVVKNGRVIGEGWHRRHGAPHAEVAALEAAGERARGATLYVTLEPCAHFGKTPPCTEAILAAGVARVVAAMMDPNPNVKGGGARVLSRRGVRVDIGLLGGEARALNPGFLRWAETGRPLVTLKIASSLDGGIATPTGDSKWITGEAARRQAHRLRAEHDGIVVGGATVEADDPELTVRHVRGRSPVRIVLDPGLATSPEARWMNDDGTRRIIVAGGRAPAEKIAAFEQHGAEVWILPFAGGQPRGASRGDDNGAAAARAGSVPAASAVPATRATTARAAARAGIDLAAFATRAASAGILSLLVEGGGRLAGAFLSAGFVDRVRIFTAPMLLGGEALRWTPGLAISQVRNAPRLRNVRVRRFGDDWQIEGDLEATCSPE